MFFSVALVHSTPRVVPLVTDVAREVMAGVKLIHMVDEGFESMIEEAGGISEPVTRRLSVYALNAHEAGAQAVIVTAPEIAVTLDDVQSALSVPVIRVDQAAAEAAVQFGSSIGVLGAETLPLEATVALIRERADAYGRDVVIEPWRCEDATPALDNNDLEAFDHIVTNAAQRLAGNDVVVLADVMMHRVFRAVSERIPTPVLTTPRHAFEDLAKKLNYFRR